MKKVSYRLQQNDQNPRKIIVDAVACYFSNENEKKSRKCIKDKTNKILLCSYCSIYRRTVWNGYELSCLQRGMMFHVINIFIICKWLLDCECGEWWYLKWIYRQQAQNDYVNIIPEKINESTNNNHIATRNERKEKFDSSIRPIQKHKNKREWMLWIIIFQSVFLSSANKQKCHKPKVNVKKCSEAFNWNRCVVRGPFFCQRFGATYFAKRKGKTYQKKRNLFMKPIFNLFELNHIFTYLHNKNSKVIFTWEPKSLCEFDKNNLHEIENARKQTKKNGPKISKYIYWH